MAFALTNRAYKFNIGSSEYAVDIFNDGVIYDAGPAVHLMYKVSDGWNRAHLAMEPVMYITQAAIDAAGGVAALCKLIVEKLNKALRILTGNAGGDDIPPGTEPHEIVMDYLREHLSVQYVDGVPTLALAD